jgi:alpha-L-fucosidase 2
MIKINKHQDTGRAGACLRASLTIGLAVMLVPLMAFAQYSRDSSLRLFYTRAASDWNEALPIGNGRLAAMIFGGVTDGRVQLNEGTIWAGEPGNNTPVNVYEAIRQIRQLIFQGKYKDAQVLSNRTFPRNAPQGSNYGMPYQSAGELLMHFPDQEQVSDYTRTLDIARAVASVRYRSGGTTFTREYFASIPDNVIIIRLTADRPASISCSLGLGSPYKTYQVTTRGGVLAMSARTGSVDNKTGKVRFQVQVLPRVRGGKVTATDTSLVISRADTVTVYLSIGTNFINYHDISGNAARKAAGYLDKAVGKDYDAEKAAHVAAYRKYFDRVSLWLGTTEAAGAPTDERVEHFSNGKDPALAALYFQFGRYLLISSSYPGSQPANLQGKWNPLLSPPWDSKYTVNINTEMNYWPAEAAALPEMHQPLFRMLEDLSVAGRQTASQMYHARGWVLHHNTDLWRITGLVDGGFYGIWPMGGAWLTQQLWQHFLFTGDTAFLRRYYPVLKGAAMFYVDVLQVEPTRHWLVVCPSMSPEHSYLHQDGVTIDITDGTTMDNQLVFDLFSHTMAAAGILGVDRRFADTLRMKRDSLPPMQIGQYGQLQEWLQDWDKPDDHHRHVSHLYGLFPSNQISLFRNPRLFEAARTSLIQRGDISTGWSMAWKINLWARLLDGNHALKLITDQIRPVKEGTEGGGTYPNLFDAHPPFQIDGNFGCTAGILHMLLQSDEGSLFILPALPDAWAAGHVRGLRARGGFIVDIAWKAGIPDTVMIRSTLGGDCWIRSYQPLRATGGVVLDNRPGPSRDIYFETPDIKRPLISSRAPATEPVVPRTYLYRFHTEPGKTYMFLRAVK